MNKKPLDLTVIIVNWNTASLLNNCLESLYNTDSITFDVTVVDNGSSDLSVSLVQNNFPQVELIENAENLGFARGNNVGIKFSESEYVCLLNSDTIASPVCFEEMLSFMTTHSDAVACGPALRLPDGKLQTGGAGFELSLSTAFNYFLFLSRLFPFKCKGFFVDQEAYVSLSKPAKVGWLAGACLLVRKSAIDVVGGLDESFFMYAEDAEWCDRLRRGGNIYYLPNLEIIHYHGASSKNSDAVSTKWLEATFKYFYSKHGAIQSHLFRAIAGCGFLLRMMIYYVLRLKDDKWVYNLKAMYKYLKFSMKWKYNQ